MTKITVGERVRLERGRRRPRLTQEELADAAGVSRPVIVRIEQDQDVSLGSLRKVLKALDLTIEVSGDEVDSDA